MEADGRKCLKRRALHMMLRLSRGCWEVDLSNLDTSCVKNAKKEEKNIKKKVM